MTRDAKSSARPEKPPAFPPDILELIERAAQDAQDDTRAGIGLLAALLELDDWQLDTWVREIKQAFEKARSAASEAARLLRHRQKLATGGYLKEIAAEKAAAAEGKPKISRYAAEKEDPQETEEDAA